MGRNDDALIPKLSHHLAHTGHSSSNSTAQSFSSSSSSITTLDKILSGGSLGAAAAKVKVKAALEPIMKRKSENSPSEGEVPCTSPTSAKPLLVNGEGSTSIGFEGMSKSEKGKAKKRRKEDLKALENPPSFAFDTRGFGGGRLIQVKDVRDLILHLLSDEKAQQWLYIANKRNIRKVVALMIPGVTPERLGIPQPPLAANMPLSLTPSTSGDDPVQSSIPVFQKLFSHACPTKAPGDKGKLHSCYQTFISCPLSGLEKERREASRKELGQKQKSSDPTVYLLTPEQMLEQAYPETDSGGPNQALKGTFDDWKRADGWIETPCYPLSPTGKPKTVLGVDCEMCLTDDGSELARVSVVDMDGNSVYDTLVKPQKPIRDHLTRYSGLTAEQLEHVETRLEDVQQALTKIISFDTILIGHSLECDLRVLKLRHPWVIDTSVIYQHPRGPPFKASLKWLTQKWLKREIQNGLTNEPGVGVGGHDSEEDAKACIDLLKLKMAKGPGFGEFTSDQETIFERIARGPNPKTSAVVDHGTPGQWHGAKATTSIACANDDEVLQGVIESVGSHDLTVGRFMDLSHALGWSKPATATGVTSKGAVTSGVISATDSSTDLKLLADSEEASSTPVTETRLVEEATESALVSLSSHLAKLHASLPPLTALIIFTGHRDAQKVSRLSAKKARFDRLWKTVKQSTIQDADRWLAEDDRNLVDEVERCRAGLSFYCIK